MVELPRLKTARLLLRPFILADAKDVQRLAGNRAIASTTASIPHPYDDGVAEQWIAAQQRRFEQGMWLDLAITLDPEGTLVGALGLRFEPEHDRAELGYWIGKLFWGRGYATEAARALLQYGFDTLGLHRIYARHFTRNPASGRVLQKISMKHEGQRRQHEKKWGSYEDEELYGILKDELKSAERPMVSLEGRTVIRPSSETAQPLA
jgi:[ribosomal protein S5]-alanine N-acetyltransferase